MKGTIFFCVCVCVRACHVFVLLSEAFIDFILQMVSNGLASVSSQWKTLQSACHHCRQSSELSSEVIM